MTSGKRAAFSWAFYDWANSAFPTVIVTFVFSAYFTKAVAPDEITGTEMWGYALSLSAFAIAVLSPILGAVADRTGRRKPWIALFTLQAVVFAALLWGAEPKSDDLIWILICFGIANIGFELAGVFYNAMLPDVAGPGRLGRLSGWAWGLGYLGGLVCLALALVLFVQADPPAFGLDTETSEHIRAVGPMVAIWFAVFALPLFLFVPEQPREDRPSMGQAVADGIGTLIMTIRQLKDHKDIAWFLLARMTYIDGLNTVFAFGGVYAAGTFGFTFEDLILFGIAMNVAAGLGAFVFGWLDDRWGPKRVIVVSVTMLMLTGTAILLVESQAMFWVFGLLLGVFVGPCQAASRTMMAHMAPEHLRTEMFGFYALSGKATAFLGPALLAWATGMFDSQRAGMATIIVFFVIGLALMMKVPDVRGHGNMRATKS